MRIISLMAALVTRCPYARIVHVTENVFDTLTVLSFVNIVHTADTELSSPET